MGDRLRTRAMGEVELEGETERDLELVFDLRWFVRWMDWMILDLYCEESDLVRLLRK